jgi:hypothetical protein
LNLLLLDRLNAVREIISGMNVNEILSELREQRDRIDAAINALEKTPRTLSYATGRKRRIMSPEARAKIAAAQRARWAKQKKKAKAA